VDPAAVPALDPLRVPVPDLVPVVALVPAHAPDLEARAAAAQDLADVPRANLALLESLVPSPGRAPEVTALNPAISRTTAPSLAINRSNAKEFVTAATETYLNHALDPSRPSSRSLAPEPDPNLAASPGTSLDPAHTRDRHRAAEAPVHEPKRTTSKWRTETAAAAPTWRTGTTKSFIHKEEKQQQTTAKKNQFIRNMREETFPYLYNFSSVFIF